MEAKKERQFFLYLGIAAILLIMAGHWPHLFHFQMYYVSSNIRAQPHFWGMRLGYVLALVVFCRLLQQAGFVGEGWLQVVSRESLMVYGAHLFLIYRLPYRGETVYDYLGQSMSVKQCIALTLGMTLLMILLAKVWSWMKANHLTTFRLGLFVACVLVVIGFFLR
jgi:surface polysaccharide O-acyltransferase-like enzyme